MFTQLVGPVRAGCHPVCEPCVWSPAFLPVYTDGWKNLMVRSERSHAVDTWLLRGSQRRMSVCALHHSAARTLPTGGKKKTARAVVENSTGATATRGSRVVSVSTQWGFSHRRPSLYLKDGQPEKNVWGGFCPAERDEHERRLRLF